MTAGSALVHPAPGALAVLGVGLATGLLNATLVRVIGLPSIIATLGTLSILQGVSLLLRDHPEGTISTEFANAMLTSVGFMPIAFIGVVVLAVLWDLWLYRSRGGLAIRAVGLDETSARRLGGNAGRVVFTAFVVCSLMAAVAGFFSASLIQTGSPHHRRLRAPEHRGRRARRSKPCRRQGIVRRRRSRRPLSLADPQRPASAPAADRVRPDRDRRSHAARADRLPGPRASGAAPGLSRRPPACRF